MQMPGPASALRPPVLPLRVAVRGPGASFIPVAATRTARAGGTPVAALAELRVAGGVVRSPRGAALSMGEVTRVAGTLERRLSAGGSGDQRSGGQGRWLPPPELSGPEGRAVMSRGMAVEPFRGDSMRPSQYLDEPGLSPSVAEVPSPTGDEGALEAARTRPREGPPAAGSVGGYAATAVECAAVGDSDDRLAERLLRRQRLDMHR